jgi:ABC-type transport system involved in cytochrome c biogenesis permease component
VCDRFREDRQQSSLELLLATPLNFSDFSLGQARRLLWQFGLPLGLVLATVPFMMFDSDGDTWPYYFVGLAILMADIWAMHFVGMQLSLTSRKPSFSASGVALRILFLPWIIFLGGIFLTVVIGELLNPRAPDWFNEAFSLGLWFFICLANNLFWGLRAMNDLKANFRQMAARAAGA